MAQNWEILIHIAKKSGLFGKATIKTTQLSKELKISQQSASRKLKELEEKSYIVREHSVDGFQVSLTDKTKNILERVKEDLNHIFRGREYLEGKVITGLGEGRFYTEQEGYQQNFKRKLGFKPYPGTLNLKTNEQDVMEFLSHKNEIIIPGFETESRTFGDLKAYIVTIEGETACIVLPKRSSHPSEIIELIAPFYLRGKFNLKDKDKVIVK